MVKKSKEQEYQKVRGKNWKSAKLQVDTLKKLRVIKLQKDLSTYDEVINFLIEDSKMLQNFKWAKF